MNDTLERDNSPFIMYHWRTVHRGLAAISVRAIKYQCHLPDNVGIPKCCHPPHLFNTFSSLKSATKLIIHGTLFNTGSLPSLHLGSVLCLPHPLPLPLLLSISSCASIILIIQYIQWSRRCPSGRDFQKHVYLTAPLSYEHDVCTWLLYNRIGYITMYIVYPMACALWTSL